MRHFYFESGTWRLTSIPPRPVMEPSTVPSTGLGLLAKKEHLKRQQDLEVEDFAVAERMIKGKAPADILEKRAQRLADELAEDMALLPLTTAQQARLARYVQLRKLAGVNVDTNSRYRTHLRHFLAGVSVPDLAGRFPYSAGQNYYQADRTKATRRSRKLRDGARVKEYEENHRG